MSDGQVVNTSHSAIFCGPECFQRAVFVGVDRLRGRVARKQFARNGAVELAINSVDGKRMPFGRVEGEESFGKNPRKFADGRSRQSRGPDIVASAGQLGAGT